MPPSVWAKELAMDGERHGKSCVTRIGVIDNDVWSCRAIATWVAGLSGFVVDWCAIKASEGLYRSLYGTTAPDVVLVDMALDGVSGVEVCRRIRERSDSIALIGMTAYDVAKYREDLIAAGVQGLVGKERLQQDLPVLLQRLADRRSGAVVGDGCKTPEGVHRIVEDKPIGRAGALTVLSRQELSVLRLYDRGFSTDEVARRLGVSTNSVSTYLRRAGQKLGASGRVEILRKGKAYDLL